MEVGKDFSCYSLRYKQRYLALNPLQRSCPSISHVFQTRAVPQILAQCFVRTVYVKTEVKLPIYCPGLDQYKCDSPPRRLLLENWVFDGVQAKRIYKEVRTIDFNFNRPTERLSTIGRTAP